MNLPLAGTREMTTKLGTPIEFNPCTPYCKTAYVVAATSKLCPASRSSFTYLFSYTSAAQFISNGSGAALMTVKNPDGSATNLIFDVHKYLDSENSGTHSDCVTNNSDVFNTLASWLRSNKRQALLSETCGGST